MSRVRPPCTDRDGGADSSGEFFQRNITPWQFETDDSGKFSSNLQWYFYVWATLLVFKNDFTSWMIDLNKWSEPVWVSSHSVTCTDPWRWLTKNVAFLLDFRYIGGYLKHLVHVHTMTHDPLKNQCRLLADFTIYVGEETKAVSAVTMTELDRMTGQLPPVARNGRHGSNLISVIIYYQICD